MTKARDLASAAPAPSTVSATEIGYLDGVSSAIQTQIDGKSGTSHNHNSDYIAKTLTTTTGDIIYASSANTPARLGVGSTGQILTVSGGVPAWAAPASGSTYAGVSVRKSSNQSIPNNTDTAITWDTENFDTDAFHNNSTNTSRLTIPSGKAGKYLLSGAISWGAATGTIRAVKIFKNGSILNQVAQFAGTNDGAISAISNVYDLAVNDYLEVYARQNSGSNLDVQSGTQQSTVQLSYLGA